MSQKKNEIFNVEVLESVPVENTPQQQFRNLLNESRAKLLNDCWDLGKKTFLNYINQALPIVEIALRERYHF